MVIDEQRNWKETEPKIILSQKDKTWAECDDRNSPISLPASKINNQSKETTSNCGLLGYDTVQIGK
jgi:hypothetical protein